MAKLLIPNLGLPKKKDDAIYLRIDGYGYVYLYDPKRIEFQTVSRAEELFHRGDLIDVKDVEDEADKLMFERGWGLEHAVTTAFYDADVIVEG